MNSTLPDPDACTFIHISDNLYSMQFQFTLNEYFVIGLLICIITFHYLYKSKINYRKEMRGDQLGAEWLQSQEEMEDLASIDLLVGIEKEKFAL